ncbi:MAG: aldo/keto reductase [Proteobacteria bacterium]|nr:aldo/keto reductase [Pseudomonadota bacterium]
MKYRKLGKTELKVSEVAVGCSGFWGNRRFSEEKAHAIIYQAFDNGVNFFDTGHNYCHYRAEPRLGRAIKNILKNHDRSQLVISSKAGTINPSSPIFSSKKLLSKDFTPDYIEKACYQSIKNLNCEYLDIFQLHGACEFQITDELLQRLSVMQAKGLFRYLGINSHAQSDLNFVAKHPDIFDMVLLDYNVLQLDREPVIEKLSQAGIGVVAGTILAQGHLLKGKIGSLKKPSDFWYLARAVGKSSARKVWKNSKAMKNVLSEIENMTPAQAAMSYVLQNKNIASGIIGTTQLPNLMEMIETTSKSLNKDKQELIQETFQSLTEKISM